MTLKFFLIDDYHPYLTCQGKGKAASADEQSDDSMMMNIDVPEGGGSDFEELDSDAPPPQKKKAPVATKPKAPAKKAPAKKAPAKGKGKKAAAPVSSSNLVSSANG